MRKSLLFLVACLVLTSCATTTHPAADHQFHRYPACVERMVGGRLLHDPGWVVGERNSEGGNRLFEFLSTYWGRIVEVTRVNRFCAAARSRFDVATEKSPGSSSLMPPPFPR